MFTTPMPMHFNFTIGACFINAARALIGKETHARRALTMRMRVGLIFVIKAVINQSE